MHTIRASARLALLLTAAGALAAAGAAPAAATDKPLPRDGIYRSLKVDDVPAAYVVLVDTSSSMQDKGPDGEPLYSTVKKRLGSFLKTLTPADEVAVVTFGRATSVVHPMSPANRTGKLLSKELPRAAEETASDHGAALNVAADQLDRSTAPVGAVLMLTDGAVNAPDSPYARLGTPAWKQLRARYDALGTNRDVIGYGLPLADGTQVSEVLGSAFGAPRILPVDPRPWARSSTTPRNGCGRRRPRASSAPTRANRSPSPSRARDSNGTAGEGNAGCRRRHRKAVRDRARHADLARPARPAARRPHGRRGSGGRDGPSRRSGRAGHDRSRTESDRRGDADLVPGRRVRPAAGHAGLPRRSENPRGGLLAVDANRAQLDRVRQIHHGPPTVTDVDLVGTVPARTPVGCTR